MFNERYDTEVGGVVHLVTQRLDENGNIEGGLVSDWPTGCSKGVRVRGSVPLKHKEIVSVSIPYCPNGYRQVAIQGTRISSDKYYISYQARRICVLKKTLENTEYNL